MGVVANLIIKVSASVTDFEKSMASLEKQLDRTGAKLKDIGGDLTKGLTLPLTALGGGAIKMAMDFETSFSGVRKTVNATEEQFAQLAAGMRALAQTKPVDVNVLNKIGEQAGQLGVGADNILKFTSTIADLTVATNLTADQAGSSMARIANVMQMPLSNVDRMGSAIVALGNFGAATEADMLNFAERIAGAGHIAGMTVPNILAIGNAFASAGVEAERGGTAIQKALLAMVQATTTGKNLPAFAKITGLSPDQFKQQFANDPSQVFLQFIQGLHDAGKGAIPELFSVGLKDQRLIGSFLNMAGAVNVLRDSLALGNKAWEQNTALTNAAEQRYKTFQNSLQLFWNQLKDVGITVGNALIPILKDLLGMAQPMIAWAAEAAQLFASLPAPVRETALALGAVLAAIGPLIYVFGTLVTTAGALAGLFGGTAASITGVGVSASGASAGVGVLATGLSLLGSVIAVVGTGIASVKFGSWIGEISGLTDWIGRLSAKFGEWIGLLPKGTAAEYAATQAARQQAAAVAELHKQLNLKFRTNDIELPSGPGANATTATGLPALSQEDEKAAKRHEKEIDKLADKYTTAGAVKELKDLEEVFTRNRSAILGNAEGVKKLLDEYDKLRIVAGDQVAPALEKLFRANGSLENQNAKLQSLLMNVNSVAPDIGDQRFAGFGLDRNGNIAAHGLSDDLTMRLAKAEPAFMENPKASASVYAADYANKFSSQLKEGFKAGVGDLPQTIMSALTGGGDVGKSIGGLFGGKIMESLSDKLSGGLSKVLGDTLGGALGSIIPGLGNLIGSMLGPLMSKIGSAVKGLWHGIQGLFGTDEEARSVNPARDAFLAQFGNVGDKGDTGAQHALAAKLTEITGEAGGGHLMQAFLAADTMDKYNAAVKAVQDALDQGAQKTNDSLQKTTDLTAGMNVTLNGSDDALKALGETQDRVVNAMLAGFDKLMAKLDEFMGKLAGANTQLQAATGGAAPTATRTEQTLPATGDALADVPGFATGTNGKFLDFGKGTLAVLHGNEMVVPQDQWKYIIGNYSGSGVQYSGGDASAPVAFKAPRGGVTGDLVQRIPVSPPTIPHHSDEGGLDGNSAARMGGVTVNVYGGTIIGNSDEFRQHVTTAVLDGIEKGGTAISKFGKLTRQQVFPYILPAGAF